MPFEERRRLFASEVHDQRARSALEALLATQRSKDGVAIANGVDDLLAGALAMLHATP